MTSEDYKAARKKLGLSVSDWLLVLGIVRDSHLSFSCGRRSIPLYIQNHIQTLIAFECALSRSDSMLAERNIFEYRKAI